MQPNDLVLARVEVIGLFGDRNVSLRIGPASPIWFLHAPNGAGKTTVLRLIKALFAADLPLLASIPFSRLEVTLSDDSRIGVVKDFKSSSAGLRPPRGPRSRKRPADPGNRDSRPEGGRFGLNFTVDGREIPWEPYGPEASGESAWQQRRFLEHYADFAMDGSGRPGPQPPFAERLSRQALRDSLPREVRERIDQIQVDSLESQRILDVSTGDQKDKTAVVDSNRRQLAGLISTVLARNANYSQELDRTLPHRFINGVSAETTGTRNVERSRLEPQLRAVERQFQILRMRLDEVHRSMSEILRVDPGDDLTDLRREAADLEREVSSVGKEKAQLEHLLLAQSREDAVERGDIESQLRSIVKLRERAVRAGLIDREQDDLAELAPRVKLSQTQREMVALYLGDYMLKLQNLDPFARRLELFTELVNERFDRKRVAIDRSAGYKVLNESSQEVEPSRLSSGEQHLLVLYYNLLVPSRVPQTYLIDEPELSLHVQWQEALTDDLSRIAALTGSQFVLATHSPTVVGRHIEWLVDLQVRYRS